MPDETQDAILDAAYRAVLDFGFEKATTKRIAAYAGLNEVTLFRKFGTKAALLTEVTRREVERLQTHIRYTGDLEADLRGIVTGYTQMVRQHGRFLVTLVGELPRRPELHGLFEKPLETFGLLVGVITRYQEEGHLRPEPPPLAVISLIGPVVLSNLAALFLSPLVPPFDPESHVTAYLSGRRARKSDHERD